MVCVRLSGAVQRAHGPQVELSGVPRPNLLPTAEAHGRRQDPLAREGPRPDPQPPADGGQVKVSGGGGQGETKEGRSW